MSIDLPKTLAHKRRVRFDETKKSVRVLLVAAAPDPEIEALIYHVNPPTPILRPWLLGLKPFGAQTIPEEFS